MDLGVQIEPQFGFSYADVVGVAREAETGGFRALWVSEHLFLGPDAVATDCLEAWTLLAALAVDTKTIRIGPMVTSQSYRNPALLAKIAAGVDQVSGGRLEFGVGAGWKAAEYKAYGYAFPDAPRRARRSAATSRRSSEACSSRCSPRRRDARSMRSLARSGHVRRCRVPTGASRAPG